MKIKMENGIYKEPNGKWGAYVDVKSTKTGERVQMRRGGLPSKVIARQTRNGIWQEAYDKANKLVSYYSWESWYQKFLEIIRCDYKNSTIENYESVFKKTRDAFLGKKLEDITPDDVKSYLYSLDVVSEKRRKKICTNFKAIFEKAVDERVITFNPAKKIKIDVQESDLRALNSNEIQKLLNEARRSKIEWYEIWVVALFTGMRTGELFALKKSSVDMVNRFIHVKEAWTKKDGYTSTKNKLNRTIPISNDLYPFLEVLLNNEDNKTEFVLPHLSKWKKGQQAKWLREFCDSIGITSVRFHDLRATFITQLLRSGRSVVDVMRIVGHSSLKVTDKYVRMSGIELEGATNQLPFSIPLDS